MNQSRRECIIGFFAAVLGGVTSAKAAPKEPKRNREYIAVAITENPPSLEEFEKRYLSWMVASMAKQFYHKHRGQLAGQIITLEMYSELIPPRPDEERFAE